mgnify:CR=1 FL=1
MQNMSREYRQFSKTVRAAAGLPGTPYPIEVVGGYKAPALEGMPFHHVNKSGARVWHPNAYRRAFGRPIYIASTYRVEVGIGWLASQGLVEPAA